ncbi:sensor histidine kinase [Luteimonas huabeiensis]|uniref:sensor histidine kinase n=1 Tax=Luteimonas huabeiensis TaxID=1244513 RepID=UPI000467CE4A|nr:ATP-binding protein [Luteimonas huabeiensis]
MWPASLSGRLMLSALLGMLAASLAAAALAVALLYVRDLEGRVDAKLVAELDELEHALRSDGAGRPTLAPLPSADMYDALRKDTAFRVVGADGRAAFASPAGLALQALERRPPGASELDLRGDGEPVRLRVREREVVRDGERYTLVAARSDRFVERLAEYARELHLGAVAATASFALAVFALVVWRNVRRAMVPLQRASAIAARIGPRTLSARLRVDGVPAEMAPLIDALNAALARLEHGFRVQQTFLATAAHELKTPLTLLQAEIELSQGTDKAAMLRETRLMARQVNQLLHLAEVSEAGNYRFARCSLWALAADAAGYLARHAERSGVALRVERTGAEPWVEADEGAVFVMLKNLLENAVRHSPAGGEVTLEVSPAGFAVSDQGPGVVAQDRAHLFERFWHGPDATGGAGLGLAIVREICVAHDWRVRFEDAAGGGARFVVAIDAADEGGAA